MTFNGLLTRSNLPWEGNLEANEVPKEMDMGKEKEKGKAGDLGILSIAIVGHYSLASTEKLGRCEL